MPSPVRDGEVDGNFLTYGVELYAWTKKTGKLLRGYPVCTKPSLFAVSPGCSRALDYSRFEASFARSSLDAIEQLMRTYVVRLKRGRVNNPFLIRSQQEILHQELISTWA